MAAPTSACDSTCDVPEDMRGSNYRELQFAEAWQANTICHWRLLLMLSQPVEPEISCRLITTVVTWSIPLTVSECSAFVSEDFRNSYITTLQGDHDICRDQCVQSCPIPASYGCQDSQSAADCDCTPPKLHAPLHSSSAGPVAPQPITQFAARRGWLQAQDNRLYCS